MTADQGKQLLQHLPIPVFICNTEGFITFCNRSAVKLWGRELLPGKEKWGDTLPVYYPNGELMPFSRSTVAKALQEKKSILGSELIIEFAAGKLHFIPQTDLIYDEQGVITGTINTLIDLSSKYSESAFRENEQQKPAEKIFDRNTGHFELKKVEELYKKMIEEVEDYAILLLDKAGNIQNWNKGAEKIKGYKEQEIIGRNFRIFYQPEDRQSGLPERLIQEAETKGKALHEGWRLRKDNTRFWGSITITAIHDRAGNVIGFSKVTRDLTEKKKTEDLIRQYAKELEFQNNELEQFAYAAAHDMKEPIRKIQFYNNYIFDTGREKLSAKENDYLQRSINAANRMKNLIDDLLTYSKLSSQSSIAEDTDLNQLFAEVCVLHQDTIQETDAVIECDVLPSITVTPFQFIRLFDNLIGNALKYRHSERNPFIKVTCEVVYTHLPKEQEEAEQELPFYKISVADTGIGFDPGEANKIFDLFQRLHNRGSYSGTGIGLAICKKIIQNHNGFITADAVPDKGAVFNLFVPVKN